MSNFNEEMYSFNDIIAAEWVSLAGKQFKRVDTEEIMGSVYGKYDNTFSLSNMLTNGRIEFLNVDRSNVKRLFGEDLKDVNEKIFIPI